MYNYLFYIYSFKSNHFLLFLLGLHESFNLSLLSVTKLWKANNLEKRSPRFHDCVKKIHMPFWQILILSLSILKQTSHRKLQNINLFIIISYVHCN